MDRRDFIKNLGIGAASLLASGCNESFAAKKLFSNQSVDVQIESHKIVGGQPNVVLVLTDDQGYGDLACLGNTVIKTPKIDAFYSQSTRLSDFHVGPTCSPTRAALMTGRYCNRTGVWHTIMGRSLLRADEVTIADVFKAAGYKTGIFGKWHLGDSYPFRPQERGFDEVLVHGGGGVTQTPDYWCNQYVNDTYYHNGVPEHYDGYCTDVWFTNAMNFITANKDKRFFCYIPTNAPHAPTNVYNTYSQPYSGTVADFFGMIANIDENFGKLRTHLQNLGLENDTILIFMTDNGTASGSSIYNGGMKGTKTSPYDGGHRVPCFIRWPNGGMQGGKDVTRLTAHIDIMPTLIDLCGINSPNVQFDGTSIKALLLGATSSWPDRTIVVDNQRGELPEKWKDCAVMTDQWRLVNKTELYKIQTDRHQDNNVAGSNPSVVSDLQNAYENWWASISTRFNEYCRVVIGNAAENPVKLTGHDGHPEDGSGNLPHDQIRVRNGGVYRYFWAVDIQQDGLYEFELRRWPKEANLPIKSACPQGPAIPSGFNASRYGAGTALNIVTASLNIANINVSKAVNDGDIAAVFQASLTAGPAELRASFTDGQGAIRSAYYVYAKRL